MTQARWSSRRRTSTRQRERALPMPHTPDGRSHAAEGRHRKHAAELDPARAISEVSLRTREIAATARATSASRTATTSAPTARGENAGSCAAVAIGEATSERILQLIVPDGDTAAAACMHTVGATTLEGLLPVLEDQREAALAEPAPARPLGVWRERDQLAGT